MRGMSEHMSDERLAEFEGVQVDGGMFDVLIAALLAERESDMTVLMPGDTLMNAAARVLAALENGGAREREAMTARMLPAHEIEEAR